MLQKKENVYTKRMSNFKKTYIFGVFIALNKERFDV